MNDFGIRLRLLRISMGLSIQEMADKLYHVYGTQIQYEKGNRHPSTARAQEIADALDVPISWLLGEGKTFAWEEQS